MENLHFSASTIAGFAVSGVGMILIPVILAIVWQKRTHAPIPPMIAGAIVFPLFALVLKIPVALPLLYLDNNVSRAINASPVLTYLVAGILAGIFEETGRLVAFSILKKKYTARETAISYGIGHGGFEAVYTGISMLSFIIMAILVNTGNTAELTKNLTPEQLPMAMEQLKQYAGQSFGMSMLGIVERIGAVTLHIGLSILVFRAVYDRRKFWLYPLAMVLHMLVDFSIVFVKDNLLLAEGMLLLLGALVLVIAVRFVYLPYQEKEESA